MSVLQKLTKAFGCSERHVERLLVEKTPAGFYRRGGRGRWRVRGPLTSGRVWRISRLWRLSPILVPRPKRAPRSAEEQRISDLFAPLEESSRKLEERVRELFEPIEKARNKVEEAFARSHALERKMGGALVAFDYYSALNPEAPDPMHEPARCHDFWTMPAGDYAKKYFPTILRAAAHNRRLVQLEVAVRRLKEGGNDRPFRHEVAKEMRQPIRTHFAWFTPHEFKRIRGETNRQTKAEEKSKLERIVEALAALGGDSDRAEDIARVMKLPAEQFRREFAALLPEAYRLADEETYRSKTYDVYEHKVDRDLT
jgi:hypothetical protein